MSGNKIIKLPVVPCTKTEVYNITSVTVNVVQINLNQSATISVTLFTDTGKAAMNTLLNMSGSDYTKWGNDDTYINKFVGSQLNITILDPPPKLHPQINSNMPAHLLSKKLQEKLNMQKIN
jgi:hypothetical protein